MPLFSHSQYFCGSVILLRTRNSSCEQSCPCETQVQGEGNKQTRKRISTNHDEFPEGSKTDTERRGLRKSLLQGDTFSKTSMNQQKGKPESIRTDRKAHAKAPRREELAVFWDLLVKGEGRKRQPVQFKQTQDMPQPLGVHGILFGFYSSTISPFF